MLFDALTGKKLERVPYKENYEKLLELGAKLDPARKALNDMIEGDEIHTAGWMPGKNWNNTPFQIIHDEAARGHEQTAAKLFGLLVFEVFMDRDEEWYTLRAEKDGDPIGSRTYFRSKK